MKLKVMLESEIDSQSVKHFALKYKSIPQMFTTSFKKEIVATN